MYSMNLSTIPNGPIAIFIIKSGSKLTAQLPTILIKPEVAVIPVVVDSYEQLPKEVFALIVQIPPNQRTNNIEDIIIFAEKKDTALKYVSVRPRPEPKYDWIEIATIFGSHYVTPTPLNNGNWGWGQIVQQEGEYLCIDCGYIEHLKVGSLFPFCEVCLSGDPNGPSELTEGHWQKIG